MGPNANPYEPPLLTPQPQRYSTDHVAGAVMRHVAFGLASGAVSAASWGIPPLGAFVPPLAFGVALGLARRSRIGVGCTLIGACCAAWVVGGVVSLLAIELEMLPPWRGFWPG